MKNRLVSMSSLLLAVLLAFAASFVPAVAGQQGGACPVASAAACGKCGDGKCVASCENATTCPKDCGVETQALLACGKCGDGRCTAQCGETSDSCPKDCGVESADALVLTGR